MGGDFVGGEGHAFFLETEEGMWRFSTYVRDSKTEGSGVGSGDRTDLKGREGVGTSKWDIGGFGAKICRFASDVCVRRPPSAVRLRH